MPRRVSPCFTACVWSMAMKSRAGVPARGPSTMSLGQWLSAGGPLSGDGCIETSRRRSRHCATASASHWTCWTATWAVWACRSWCSPCWLLWGWRRWQGLVVLQYRQVTPSNHGRIAGGLNPENWFFVAVYWQWAVSAHRCLSTRWRPSPLRS